MTSTRIAWYGKLPPVSPRIEIRIWLGPKYCIDGEDATQMIRIGTIKQREDFIDTLPQANCYENLEKLEEAFSDYLKQKKNEKKK